MDPREVLTGRAARPDAVLRYGDHPDHLLDLHLPAGTAGRAPVVLLVHGGFWRHAVDRAHTRPLAQALTAEGWAVVTPEFRRTGDGGGWPATFDDVATAAEQLPLLDGLAPDRLALDEVTVVGHSAGGHLAMWLALSEHRPAAPRLRRVVALAPVADLRDAHARNLDDGAVATLMGGSPGDRPDEYAAADPAGLLSRGSGRPGGEVEITVLHGDRDQRVPVQMSRRLDGVRYVELPGVEHFGLVDPLSAAWPYLCAELVR